MLCCAVGGFGGKGGRAEAGRNTVWNSLQELLREDDRVAGFRLHALRTHTTLSPASSVPSFCQPATIVPAAWGLSGLEYLDEWAGGSVGELALEGRVEVLLVARTDHSNP